MSVILSGCVSGKIIAGGKKYEHLHKKKTSDSMIRECFGEPAWRKIYNPPMRICDTAEFRSWENANGWSPAIFGVEKAANEHIVSVCEVYKVTDLLADSDRLIPYAMAVGCTLGLAELADLFYIPYAINWRSEHAHDVSWLTYWFDDHGFYVGFSGGDIRNIHYMNSMIDDNAN